MPDLYIVTHSSPELDTVGEYLNNQSSPAYTYRTKPEKFLDIVGNDGLTNRQRIEVGFKTSAEKKFIGVDANNLPLKVGTVLYIEYSEVNKISWVTEGIEVVSTDDVAFKAAKLADLESDEGYVQVIKPYNGMIQKGTVKQSYPDVTVWIWCRGLSPKEDEASELTGQFFDLTPFVQKMVTNVGKNGGNFQITLPPLICELDQENRWQIKEGTLIHYETDKYTSLQGQGYVSQASLLHEEGGLDEEELVLNKFLFHNVIRSNDLIFIRFETLHVEREQRFKDAKEFFINKNLIANRIYDMIGLVDRNFESISPPNNEVKITISGRDLSKLFIEDGTYFYALENSQGLLKFAGQTTQKNSQINRIFGNGALNFIGLYMFTSIEYILKFILQQLANISIVPSAVFSSYATSVKMVDGVPVTYDSRNKRYIETEDVFNKVETDKSLQKPNYNAPVKEELANGIWQIVKLVIDKSVTDRRLADSSFSTAQGSLLNFIRSAVQEPLAEFYMDTYGDQYHLIVRKPPYDQKALVSLIEGKINTEEDRSVNPAIIDIDIEDVLDSKLSMDDSQVYSWYHFFPKNDFFGDAKSYSLAYLGALFFEEYGQIFGSKPFQGSHPYLPFVPKNKRSNDKLDIYERQAINDLRYVIECNQYLPFTRKGTLVLNRDRRLKIGNIIRYKPTGEIFFIDSVQHTHEVGEAAIQAKTTINVSRGLVEQFIYGTHLQSADGSSKFISYFNCIDTRLEFEEREYVESYTENVKVGERKVKVSEKRTAPNATIFSTGNIGFIEHGEKVKGLRFLERYNAYPSNKIVFIKFINAIVQRGYEVHLVSGSTNRTYAEQAALKRKNINNAKAGTSRHEKGAAIDITLFDPKANKYYSKTTSEQDWRSTGVPTLALSMGLQWGDETNTGTFGKYVDRVHFQISSIDSEDYITEPVYEEVTKTRTVRGLDREGIFRNFKVNKHTLNFFLKNLQFDPDFRVVKNRTIVNTDEQGSLLPIIIKSKGGRK